MKSLRLFRSVRFNIGLFFAIAVASAIGTLLPQAPETPEKVDVFMRAYPFWGRLFGALGLFHLYQSWWYLGMLVLMAFDIVVCKLWKTPPDPGLVSMPPELAPEADMEGEFDKAAASLRLKPMHASFLIEEPPAQVVGRLRAFMEKEGYRIQEALREEKSARWSLVGTRHRLQRWGSYVAHVALVVILLGGLIKQLYGFVEMVPVLEGRSRNMQNKPDWELFVDKFTVQYYEGTATPKRFASDLRVEKNGEELGRKTIIVNDPLDIGGVRFYQASWGAGGMFRSVTLRLGRQELQLPQRTALPIPGTKIHAVAEMMLPNFTVGADGRADSASLDLKNPAVKLVFKVGGVPTRPLWLLQRSPEVAFAEGDDGVLSHIPPPPFKLAEIDPILFSGIQVAYDPGFKVVLGGAVAWLVGMILLFYLHRRRFWFLVGPAQGDGRAQVLIGAWSSRGSQEFQKEFNAFVGRLQLELGGGAPGLSPAP